MIALSTGSKRSFEFKQRQNKKDETNSPDTEDFIKEARNLARVAEDELDHGVEALFDMMEKKRPELKSIAEWHFRQSLEKAGQAREKLVAARDGLTNAKRLEYCRLKITEIDEMYLKANGFLDKITKKSRETVVGRENE